MTATFVGCLLIKIILFRPHFEDFIALLCSHLKSSLICLDYHSKRLRWILKISLNKNKYFWVYFFINVYYITLHFRAWQDLLTEIEICWATSDGRGIDEKGLHLHEKELESFIISKNVVLYNIFCGVVSFGADFVFICVVGVGKDGGGVIFTFSNLSHVRIIYFLSLVSRQWGHGRPVLLQVRGVELWRTGWLYTGVCALVTRDNGERGTQTMFGF